MKSSDDTFVYVKERIKDNLINLRKERGMSQRDLAGDIGLSQSFINMIEQGKRDLHIKTLHKIATYYDVQIHDLVCIDKNYENLNNIDNDFKNKQYSNTVVDFLNQVPESTLEAIARAYISGKKER
ncbi:hypothetical protein CR203_18225 [Salipaludibacillus neizhouensis]|uniref:HTH cro/C1-type domain-containing protein n=1 Tax=Salipaludibacillus neizhouensis TaxID=885475 RepID=A0A3A9K4K3_9BACI|nr:helix-turn-helix transcriptional regulator [Salipaludibacillus neizhouensis]RKL65800.1 hypothetical protein CR203_18225 [Salipaludibacillus neizhouensis]